MPRKRKNEKDGSGKLRRYFIGESWELDACSVDFCALPEDIIDEIPGECVYDVPKINSEGKIEVQSVIYLVPLPDDVVFGEGDHIKCISPKDSNIQLILIDD